MRPDELARHPGSVKQIRPACDLPHTGIVAETADGARLGKTHLMQANKPDMLAVESVNVCSRVLERSVDPDAVRAIELAASLPLPAQGRIRSSLGLNW